MMASKQSSLATSKNGLVALARSTCKHCIYIVDVKRHVIVSVMMCIWYVIIEHVERRPGLPNESVVMEQTTIDHKIKGIGIAIALNIRHNPYILYSLTTLATSSLESTSQTPSDASTSSASSASKACVRISGSQVT